jgi:magnesium-dependent phosphatase-1
MTRLSVRLVILDCDRTLWDHADVSALTRPFRRVGTDAVEDMTGARVTLFPDTRQLLDGLRTRRLLIACASWNQPQPVNDIFTLLEIGSYFDYRKVEPHPDKHRTIGHLLGELAAHGVRLAPAQVLYVDDRRVHLDAIYETIGPIRFLQYGVDVSALTGVLAYLDRLGSDAAPV